MARFIESASGKLQEGVEAMGYCDARFSITPVRRGGCWALNVDVQPLGTDLEVLESGCPG